MILARQIAGLVIGTGNGWLAATLAGLVAFAVWRAYDVHHQRAIGASREVARIEERGEINAKKADAARRTVERLPASRLCDRYSRDC